MADGTTYQIDVQAQDGGSTDALAAKLGALSDRLTAAGAASTAASEAVKAGEATYRAAETAADRAAKALEKITLAADAQKGKLQAAIDASGGDGGAAVDRARAKLDALIARQTEAASKATSAKSALDAEAASLDRLKVSAAAAEAEEKQLDKAQSAAEKSAKDASKAHAATAKSAEGGTLKVNELAEGFGKLGGPAGVAGQKVFGLAEGVKKLSASLGAAGPYAAVAIAIVAIATAAIVATAAILKWSIGMADANRTAELLNAGITQSVEGGKMLTDKIGELSSRVPQSSSELQSMAANLAKTGLRGKELGDALEDAAVRAAQAKFGPEWEKQLLGLDKQSEIFHNNISKLFGGLKIEGALGGLQKLIALFDSSTASGKAMKAVFESVFQPLLNDIPELATKAEAVFLQLEIYALKAYLALAPYAKQINAVAGGLVIVAKVLGAILVVALAAAVVVGVAFLTIISTVWRVIIDWGQSLVTAGQTVWAFGVAIMNGAGAALDWLTGKLNGAIDWLRSINLGEIGQAMIDGLIAGITGGAGGILSAVTGAVGGAIDGAKKLLQINSPSKVFASIGASTGEGMVDGVEGATSDVQASVEKMVEPPKVAAIEPPAVAKAATPASSLASQAAAPIASAAPAATVAVAPAAAAPASAAPVAIHVAAPALEKSATPAAPTLEQIAPAAAAPAPAAPASSSDKSGGNTFQITVVAPDGDAKSLAEEIKKVLLDVLEGDVAQLGGAVPA